MLDICFEVLDNSNKALEDTSKDLLRRGDPVYISRTLTAMVRSLTWAWSVTLALAIDRFLPSPR